MVPRPEEETSGAVTSNGDSRFRCLVESTSDGYLAYDAAGRLVDVNQSACEVSGHARESLLGTPVSDLLESLDGQALTDVDGLFCDGRPARVNARLTCADGAVVPTELRVGAVEDDGAV